jgi:hypothetical protein
MSAIVTTLDKEIRREERLVGIPTDKPLSDAAIAHRRIQIAVLLVIAACVAVFAAFSATGQVRLFSIALAGLFAVYALEKDRHLRRLAVLHGSIDRITLVVANELLHSGALRTDRELLDVRDGLGRAAGRLAAALSEIVHGECTRVRVTGPAGEAPVAAERDLVDHAVVDDPTVARDAVRGHAPIRRQLENGRTVLAVPMWRGNDVVGVLEAVSAPHQSYSAADVAAVRAFARGAIAALLAPPA